MSPDLVVHPDGGGLVDADEHRLALVAAREEVGHDVLGDDFEPVVAGDEVVFAAEVALQPPLLGFVQLGGFEDALDVLVEVLVGDLQLGDAVLVVERDGRAVLDRLAEVVDADVVAEDLAGPLLLALDQRRAGEAEEGRVRQGVAHVEGEGVVLAAVGLVGDDDDVVALGDHRVALAALGVELLDQGEDVAVVLAEQLPQVLARFGVGFLLGDRAGAAKLP